MCDNENCNEIEIREVFSALTHSELLDKACELSAKLHECQLKANDNFNEDYISDGDLFFTQINAAHSRNPAEVLRLITECERVEGIGNVDLLHDFIFTIRLNCDDELDMFEHISIFVSKLLELNKNNH